MFKVGDNVRCIKSGNHIPTPLKMGHIYTVTDIESQEHNFIRVEGYEEYWRSDRFELIDRPAEESLSTTKGFISGTINLPDLNPEMVGKILLSFPNDNYKIVRENDTLSIFYNFYTHNQLRDVLDALNKLNINIE